MGDVDGAVGRSIGGASAHEDEQHHDRGSAAVGKQTLVQQSAVLPNPTEVGKQTLIEREAATARWNVVASPYSLQFPSTEVGAVSPPRTLHLKNCGDTAVAFTSFEVVLYGGTSEPAQPGEFELLDPRPRQLPSSQTTDVQVAFRPARLVRSIGAHLRARGSRPHEHIDVPLKAVPAAPRADHADLRELSVAQDRARQLEAVPTPRVQHYADLLAAVLAAQSLSDRATADADARASVVKLLEPVAERLDQLNDHQGRLAQFGAGNIAGQSALDMSQTAIRSWLQRLKLGARIDAEELVTRFRAGAEPIRLLTGERHEAPTLSAFDQASHGVAAGVGALVLAPGLIALVAEEVPVLAFAGRLAAQRVLLWALANPAAALAASEALLAFGLQIGEDGWEPFWDQLCDPRGRWFIIVQVLLDYMHIKSGMSGHAAPARDQRGSRSLPAVGGEPGPASGDAVDIGGARERVRKLRAVVRQVHDDAAHAADATEPQVDTRSSRGSAADHDTAATSTQISVARSRREAAEQPQRAQRAGGRYGVLDDPTADILNDPEPTPDVQQLRDAARAAHPDDTEGQRDYIWKRLKSGALRKSLLARGPAEIKAVSRALQEFGVKEATPAAVEDIFAYLFDSSGISFSYENYVCWTRLAQGRGRITDARFIVHELSEIGLLKKHGIDFMGQSYRVGSEAHERWASETFDPAYARAHKQALRVEYEFLAEQLARVRGGAERSKPEVVAAVASTFDENSVQACGLMETPDGKIVSEHRLFPEWQRRAAEPVTLSPENARQLGLSEHTTLAALLRAIREAPLSAPAAAQLGKHQ